MLKQNKITKREIREHAHITRPPRLEGSIKNTGTSPVRKAKAIIPVISSEHPPQGYTDQERKDYQLRSKHH